MRKDDGGGGGGGGGAGEARSPPSSLYPEEGEGEGLGTGDKGSDDRNDCAAEARSSRDWVWEGGCWRVVLLLLLLLLPALLVKRVC